MTVAPGLPQSAPSEWLTISLSPTSISFPGSLVQATRCCSAYGQSIVGDLEVEGRVEARHANRLGIQTALCCAGHHLSDEAETQ